jgi:hypothetical protein
MNTLETNTEKRGLDTSGIYWREYDAAKKSWPNDGPQCWQWYAEQAAGAAMDGYASVAG